MAVFAAVGDPIFEIIQKDKFGGFGPGVIRNNLGVFVITDANMRVYRLALHQNRNRWLRFSGCRGGPTDTWNQANWGPGSANRMIAGRTRYTTG